MFIFKKNSLASYKIKVQININYYRLPKSTQHRFHTIAILPDLIERYFECVDCFWSQPSENVCHRYSLPSSFSNIFFVFLKRIEFESRDESKRFCLSRDAAVAIMKNDGSSISNTKIHVYHILRLKS